MLVELKMWLISMYVPENVLDNGAIHAIGPEKSIIKALLWVGPENH